MYKLIGGGGGISSLAMFSIWTYIYMGSNNKFQRPEGNYRTVEDGII